MTDIKVLNGSCGTVFSSRSIIPVIIVLKMYNSRKRFRFLTGLLTLFWIWMFKENNKLLMLYACKHSGLVQGERETYREYQTAAGSKEMLILVDPYSHSPPQIVFELIQAYLDPPPPPKKWGIWCFLRKKNVSQLFWTATEPKTTDGPATLGRDRCFINGPSEHSPKNELNRQNIITFVCNPTPGHYQLQ